jgi:hypothetical protein
MAVEACLKSGRQKSARALLAEMVEQIDRYHLQEWEPVNAITAVYRGYLTLLRDAAAGSADAELAGRLFEKLLRLDPRSALELEQGGLVDEA